MTSEAHPRRWLFFFMVSVGVFLSTMDSSMINIALPSIMRSFAAPLYQVEWVVLVYLLTITVSLLVWGKLSDRWGKGVVYLWGMFVFSLGSGCCYFSPSLSFLICFRFVQALGASMMMSTGPAIIRLVFPKQNLGRALGAIGIATSIGLMSGPVVGGFLIHTFSWRAIFLITVPINLSVLLVGYIFLAGRVPKIIPEKTTSFDWIGAIIWTFLISCFVTLVSSFDQLGIVARVGGILVFSLLFYCFLLLEIHNEDPLFPITLLRKKYYGIAMLTSSISFAVLFVILILMPFYLDYIIGLSVDRIGFVMMAVPVTLFIVSPLSGWLYDLIGARVLTTTGLFICCLAIVCLSLLDAKAGTFDIAWRLMLLGTGQAIFLSPNTASVLGRISDQHTGITSGMLATSRNLGMLSGVALAGLIFMSFYSYLSGGLEVREFTGDQTAVFMLSFKLALVCSALLAFTGAVFSWKREDNSDGRG